MAGRALAFSDPEIVRMATEEYVPVTGDDWYQRRREDPEGKFFHLVSDQAGRGSKEDNGGSTRQGIYCLTAGGKLLAYKNAGQAPDVMREVLQRGLAEWNKLPDSQRRQGAIQVEDMQQIDERFSRTPPPGGLVLNVCTRALDRDAKGELCDAVCKIGGGDEPGRDHLWLTESEWKSLVPAGAKKGGKYPLPVRIVERICRFHLVDNTRGEPPSWRREDIRSSEFTLTVEETSEANVRMRLDGSAVLATNGDISKAGSGYDVRLLGYLSYSREQKALERFDVVAVGEHWGEGTYTRGARPGRTLLGVAFELTSRESPAAKVPPQGAREIREYLGPAEEKKGGEKGVRTIYPICCRASCFWGLPRGRMVRSRFSFSLKRVSQVESPKGKLRSTLRRMAASSSASGVWCT